jgi:GNAT superfamily N-acetyltransferase
MLVEYSFNKASEAEIAEHLTLCDVDFVPPLSCRVDIRDYAKKIASNAVRFEAWLDCKLIGLVAAYCNDGDKLIAYITSVSILREWTKNGIGANLLCQCVEYAKSLGIRNISLEVEASNVAAIKLYEKSGFIADNVDESFVKMNLLLKSGGEHEHLS